MRTYDVQRRATRFVYNSYDRFTSPSVMIEELGWELLIERRAKSKAIRTYKILNQLMDIPQEKFSQSNINNTRSETALYVPYCRTDIYKSVVPYRRAATH